MGFSFQCPTHKSSSSWARDCDLCVCSCFVRFHTWRFFCFFFLVPCFFYLDGSTMLSFVCGGRNERKNKLKNAQDGTISRFSWKERRQLKGPWCRSSSDSSKRRQHKNICTSKYNRIDSDFFVRSIFLTCPWLICLFFWREGDYFLVWGGGIVTASE